MRRHLVEQLRKKELPTRKFCQLLALCLAICLWTVGLNRMLTKTKHFPSQQNKPYLNLIQLLSSHNFASTTRTKRTRNRYGIGLSNSCFNNVGQMFTRLKDNTSCTDTVCVNCQTWLSRKKTGLWRWV